MTSLVKQVSADGYGIAEASKPYLYSDQFQKDFVWAAKVATKIALGVLAAAAVYGAAAGAVFLITSFGPGTLPIQAIFITALASGVWKDVKGPLSIVRTVYDYLGDHITILNTKIEAA